MTRSRRAKRTKFDCNRPCPRDSVLKADDAQMRMYIAGHVVRSTGSVSKPVACIAQWLIPRRHSCHCSAAAEGVSISARCMRTRLHAVRDFMYRAGSAVRSAPKGIYVVRYHPFARFVRESSATSKLPTSQSEQLRCVSAARHCLVRGRCERDIGKCRVNNTIVNEDDYVLTCVCGGVTRV